MNASRTADSGSYVVSPTTVAPGARVRVPPTTTTDVSPAPPAVPTCADGCRVTSAPIPTTVLRTVPAIVALPPKTTTLSAVVPCGTVMF